MRSLMLVALALPVWASALTQKDFSMGIGMETRASREVNPDYVTPKYSGMLFAKLRLRPWNALLEISRDERDSSSGDLRIYGESTRVAAWGRYEFLPERMWTPFAAVGAGVYFDKISTSFEQTQISRSGTRGLVGLGAGVAVVLWEHLSLEGEGRVESVEIAHDPVLTGLIRVGCQM